MVAFQHLPLYQSIDLISSKFDESQNLILTSPTGSGKSVLIPFLASQKCVGRVVVLEPRKIAAQSLAGYLASLLKEPCGESVGYQFHLESCKSPKTRILFQTYGSFLQELLHGEAHADILIFDEFHERRAEMDLLMTFFRKSQELKKENAPRIIVLSAKMAVSEIEPFLKTSSIELHTASFPVQILYQKKLLSYETDLIQALRTLQRNELWQTTLIFLPGKYEIKKVRQFIEEAFGFKSLEILELFSGQTQEELKRLFTPKENPRIILSTNVAETSLTIPNVSAVIDSGLERFSEFDESEGVSTLRLSRITLQNAIQRTGRAGRTQAGVCIRLWDASEEALFSSEIIPDVKKIALTETLLQQAFLAKSLNIKSSKLGWISAPKSSLYLLAKQTLESLDFFANDEITELGQKALSIPLQSVSLSSFVLKTISLSEFSIKIIAWIDSGNEFLQRQKKAFNLIELADSSMPKEVSFTFNRLQDYCRKQNKLSSTKEKEECALLLLQFFKEQLAIANGNVYKTQSGKPLQINEAIQKGIQALIPFALWRTENRQKSELRATLYYPIAEALLKHNQNDVEYDIQWRVKQSRFICIEIQKKGTLEVSRKEILPQDTSSETQKQLKEKVTQAWLEKLDRENLSHLYENEETSTWLSKMKLAAKYFPEYSLPQWNEEDFLLIKEELVDGIFLERDITPERYLKIIKDYFGKDMLSWLSKTFPDSLILKNGKRAKYIYSNDDLVEISARLGDFIGMQGKHFIADGKIPVRYDILAPNYRTVQKTWDLSGFWEKTYPEIRKELRGRYPKHPWPEKI